MKHAQYRYASLLASLVLLANSAMAASFQFEANAQAPLYQTTLPKAVYAHSRTQQLADLTISNAAGEQVPYALVPYTTLYPQAKEQLEIKPLALFPITEATLNAPDALRIALEKTAGSTAINISTGDTHTNYASKQVYLVDAGEKHPALQTLNVDWQGAAEQFIRLEILTSDDLKSWSPAGNGVLLKTTRDGSSVINHHMHLDHPTSQRYLQIRLSEPLPDFKLTLVNAEYRSEQALTLPYLWQTLNFLNRAQEDKTGAINLEFEALGHYPATRLQIKLPQANTITNVVVSIRNKSNEPWRYYLNASLYHMQQEGKTTTNPDINIDTTTARYWQLQFNQASGGIGAQNPELLLGWLPDTVVWNARGNAPFSLHVGENPNIVNTVAIASLIPAFTLDKVKALPNAKLANQAVQTSNTSASTDTPSKSAWVSPPDYKTWGLWAGLVLGVLLLAGMAYSLAKGNQK